VQRFALCRFKYDANASVQRIRDSAQRAERVAFVTGRFQAAHLLLRGLEKFSKVLLGEAGSLT
jgi:hypothetical protein